MATWNKLRSTIKVFTIVAFAACIIATGCQKETYSDNVSDKAGSAEPSASKTFKSSGVVEDLDQKDLKIAINHGEIPGFMPAMTMTYAVRDKKMIESTLVGDKIDFELQLEASYAKVIRVTKTGEDKMMKGAGIFKASCAKCHGANGEGTRKGISFLEGHALLHPKEDFVNQVINGKEGKMPSFKDKFSADEIEAVVTYVRDGIQKRTEKKEEKGLHQH